jgi:hypothetical protein
MLGVREGKEEERQGAEDMVGCLHGSGGDYASKEGEMVTVKSRQERPTNSG